VNSSWQVARDHAERTNVLALFVVYGLFLVLYSVILVCARLALDWMIAMVVALLLTKSMQCVCVCMCVCCVKSLTLRDIAKAAGSAPSYEFDSALEYSPSTTNDNDFSSVYTPSSSKKKSQTMVRYDMVPPVAYSHNLDESRKGALWSR
jgi:hypothetical protein